MRQRHFIWIISIAVVAVVVLLSLIQTVHAQGQLPYSNYYISPSGEILPVPAPYVPAGTIRLQNQQEPGLNKPRDLFIDEEDRLYVADTGNNRVVAMDPSGQIIRIYGVNDQATNGEAADSEQLKEPSGIFVDESGTLFVADTGNKRIVVFDKSGNQQRIIGPPDSSLLGDNFVYSPMKVVVDSRGYFYIVSQGTQRGLLMLDSQGKFRGYFGANKTEAGPVQAVIRFLYSKKSRQRASVSLPYSFNNVLLSPAGFLYTTTTGIQSSSQVRKLNAVGGDILPGAGRNFADPAVSGLDRGYQIFTDAAVDAFGNMTLLDSIYGRMYQYDAAGRQLFVFGGTGSGKGLPGSPQSISVDSRGYLYVLDAARGEIQYFRPTPFAESVHLANELYAQGRYQESFEPWEEVLRMDSHYELALQAMGQTKLRMENYPGAMTDFIAASDQAGYSDAFYEQRRLFIRDHFGKIASLLVVVLVVVFILKSVLSRRGRSTVHTGGRLSPPLLFTTMLAVLKQPISTFEALRYEGIGRLRDALLLVFMFSAAVLLSYLLPSFPYRPIPLELVRPVSIVCSAIGAWLVWCVVQYGLTTILSGVGRIKDVLIGTAYCFTPYILFSIPLQLLTHILTLKEKPLYDLFMLGIYAWVIVLLFVKIREIHFYNGGKSLVVGVLTALGCIAGVGFAIVLYGMCLNLYEFADQLIREVNAYGP